jgi:hypothetical protein
MIDLLLTKLVYYWLRTGSAGLLLPIENPPISSPRMASKLTHTLELARQIKTPDSRNHRSQVKKPANRFSNPHSSVETNQTHLPRPRGFLP